MRSKSCIKGCALTSLKCIIQHNNQHFQVQSANQQTTTSFIMQLTNILAFLALTAVGAVAAPGKPAPPPKPVAPPKPAPPVINNQVVRSLQSFDNSLPCAKNAHTTPSQNYCSSGSPFCCSPTVDNDGKGGTTCKVSTTQCNSISICCNNAQNGGAPSVSTYSHLSNS